MKMIFLFGHRSCPNQAWRGIYGAAEYFIKEFQGEEICFVVGHRGDFDTLATRAISIVKGCHPEVKLLQLIAYYNPVRPHYTIEEIDATYYPLGLETVPKPYAIVKANQYVVSNCDAVICYVNREGSNTYKLLRKAQRRNIPIINLAEIYPPKTLKLEELEEDL